MSDLSNNQQILNPHPESDSDAPDSPASLTTPDLSPNQPTFVSTEIPLPDFPDDELKPERPKTSTSSTGLEEALAGRSLENASESSGSPAGGVYKISSANPDWSEFSLTPPPDPASPGTEPESVSGWKTVWAVIREVGETVLLTLIIFFLIQTVIRNFRVVGTSMVDNLHDGQYLIIDKFSYSQFANQILGIGGPKRGDVIVFEPPNRPGEDYVKRIIGLPGEKVQIVKGQVFINDQPLAEPFQPRPGSYSMPPEIIPEGQIFVLGDNRNNSNDSHNWGTLPLEKIVGRAWLSYWPPEIWGVIPRDEPTEQATLKHFLNDLIVSSASAGSE